MYVPIGADFSVRSSTIVGIFDLDNTTISAKTRAFLSEAEQRGEVIDISNDLPKSYVITEEFGLTRIYLTQFYANALEKRIR